MAGPLEGKRVLELSHQVVGRFLGALLADLGAEVIAVENVTPLYDDTSHVFLGVSRNKKNMTVDLRKDEGKEIFYRLSKGADVIVENFGVGVAKRLRVDYEAMKEINPTIVYCSISAFGQDGPYANRPAWDTNIAAISGFVGLCGPRDGPPFLPGIVLGDFGAVFCGAISILAALLTREKTEMGQFIDVAMLDAAVWQLSMVGNLHLLTGSPVRRGEITVNGGSPACNIYETKDAKYITVCAYFEPFWSRLCELLGLGKVEIDMEDLRSLSEPRESWKAKRDEIFSLFRKAFITKIRDEWALLLEKAGIPYGPVNSLEEVFSDPQVLHRQMVMEIDHPKLGNIRQIGIPFKFSKTPAEFKTPPPVFGQHTDETLRLCGYSKDEIEELRQKEVI